MTSTEAKSRMAPARFNIGWNLFLAILLVNCLGWLGSSVFGRDKANAKRGAPTGSIRLARGVQHRPSSTATSPGNVASSEPLQTDHPSVANPFPLPPELAAIDLSQQTVEEAQAKSWGCVQ